MKACYLKGFVLIKFLIRAGLKAGELVQVKEKYIM